jgi:hypothetical protein
MARGARTPKELTPTHVRRRLGVSMRNLERLTRITAWTIHAYERGEKTLTEGQIRYLDRVYKKLGELLAAVNAEAA